jgi:hypothetical protein
MEPRPRALGERGLLRLTLGFAVLAQVGAHIDGWYHLHRGFAIESFWTWPHLVFYAGKLGMVVTVLGYLAGSAARRLPRRTWLPPGYPLVLVGSGLFFVGGAFDIAWHGRFGFEADVAALLSPAHLWLWVAALVTQFGVLQAALAARAPVAATLALAVLCRATLWNLIYADPLAVDYASGASVARGRVGFAGVPGGMGGEIAGTTGLVLHVVLVVLFLLAGLRHCRLGPGTVAAVLLWNGVLTAGATGMWRYLPAVALAALAGEATWHVVRRGGLGGPDADAGYRLVGFVVPAVEFAAYVVLAALVGGGIAWPVHVAAGAPLIAGLYGVVASLLVVPPRRLRLP